tara:strand:+ start:112 stop:336 length:225 start_codon:yes stop_codon:yes gene_type:complete
MRTKKGNVTAKAREEAAVLPGGKFPIFDVRSAKAALQLRGHAQSASARSRIINKAEKFVPRLAKKAREEDKEKA